MDDTARRFIDESNHYYLMSRKRVLPVCVPDLEAKEEGETLGGIRVVDLPEEQDADE